jgi:hypothetical protein
MTHISTRLTCYTRRDYIRHRINDSDEFVTDSMLGLRQCVNWNSNSLQSLPFPHGESIHPVELLDSVERCLRDQQSLDLFGEQ